MTSDLRLIETACIHCLYKPVFGTELGKSSSVAFNSQTTLPKLVFTDCWDLANPNIRKSRPKYPAPLRVSTDVSPDRISRALANCNVERFHPYKCAIYT
jgi:hypothetical protein